MSNDLTVKIYSSGTTEVPNVDDSIVNAIVESLEKQYLGGLCTSARVFVPRDVTRAWPVKEMQRIAVYNGLRMIWEGKISEISNVVDGDRQGCRLECVGQTATLFNRTWQKVWADQRLTDAVWVRQAQGDHDNMANIDRVGRVGVGPQVRAWSTNDIVAAFRYTMPTGETIKRIKATLTNRENGQDWITRIYDPVGTATLFSETGDGVTTATDHTLATPRQYVEFQFVSNANQTPTIAYGRMSTVMVYSETGGITPTSIMKNIRAFITDLNSDESKIATNALTLEPFMTNGRESLLSIAARVAAFGDGSYNPWAWYLDLSYKASSPDGKPVLVFEQYPALTSYDYAIRIDEKNLVPPIEFKRSIIGSVANWIVVQYRDELDNRDVVITPDDDANLKDTTSIATWGQQELVVNVGTATATTAKNYARRVLAYKKDPKYRVAGPINVKGWIRTSGGNEIPACEISPGKRLKVENYLSDKVGVTNAGLTSIITATSYKPETETNSLTLSVPDNLAVYLAQRSLR